MSETNKTLVFLAVAAVTCAAAYVSRPTTAEFDVASLEGTLLSEPFDEERAKRLKIMRFDEDSATLTDFEVAEEGGVWTIPSKGGYPADAERQMAEAATGVMDREILAVVSQNAADHAQYGVIDPRSPKLEVGQTGVGVRVTLNDEKDDPLVDLIIGKPVKDTEDQHYVRHASRDAVYTVEIDPTDFSTTFEDWIEDDLLKISPWDIQTVRLNDYSAEMFPTGGRIGVELDYRTDITLKYDDSESEWTPVVMKRATDPRGSAFEEFTLAEDEELDSTKLNDLKNALDDLRIVDVSKKPAGLSANLKAGESFLNDLEAQLSLIQRGFAPMGAGQSEGEVDILSSEGEVVCGMKDGVEYVLRFGNLQLTASEEAAPPNADEDGAEEEAQQEAVNRYLFVMARFNENAIERPELEDVPALPEGAEPSDADASDGEAASEEPNASEESAVGDGADAGEEAAGEESDTAEEDEPQSELEKAIAERKRIEKENQRKLDEYADKIKKGKERVEELNARFGDWYYVISNDVFKKIHLSRDDVIKKKEADEESDDAADASQDDAGPLGAPGSTIPGMPDLSGVGDNGADAQADTPGADDEPAPVIDESSDETAADEPSDEE